MVQRALCDKPINTQSGHVGARRSPHVVHCEVPYSVQLQSSQGEVRVSGLTCGNRFSRGIPFFNVDQTPGGEVVFAPSSVNLELYQPVDDRLREAECRWLTSSSSARDAALYGRKSGVKALT